MSHGEEFGFYPVYSGRPSGVLSREVIRIYLLFNNFACFMENRLQVSMLVIYCHGTNYPQTWQLKTTNIVLSHTVSEDQESVSGLAGGCHSEFLMGCGQPVVGAVVL